VANIVFQGDTLLLHVGLADGSAISVRGPSHEGAALKVPAVGSPIRLGFGAGDAILLPADGG
jgi:putative spermidine/putrescine transport system ATP-binding protein